MDELIIELNLDKSGTYVEDKYVVNLGSSNAYQKLFDTLDRRTDLEVDNDSAVVNEDENKVVFFNDTYTISLDANFSDSNYTCVIEENI